MFTPTRIALIAAALIAAVALVAVNTSRTTAAGDATLTLSLNGLETLDSGHYEGWAIVGDDKISTGKFNIAGGSLWTLAGDMIDSFTIGDDVSGASQFVLTIEPGGDTDAIPSGIVVLAGPLADGAATLAFPVDLSSIAGGYILATPTDDVDDNDVAGLWFLDPAGPSAALTTLPELPSGWVYEGWGVTQGTPLTSGRFTSAEGADQSAPYSGPNAGPPFPGEDFLVNLPSAISSPVDLADGASTIVLSVEPDLDGVDPTGDAPFSIKPLVAPVPSGLADHTLTALDQNLGSVPTGTATLDASAQVAVPAAADTGNAGLAASSGSGGTAAFAFGALAVLLGGAYVARRGLGRGRA